MKRCAVVCNGTISDYQWLSVALSGYEAVFAADGGLDHCRRAGVRPAAVLGDMDSLAGKEDDAQALIRFPAEKDFSDMELAVDHALGNGFGAVDVFGALGGRIDHELCNVMVCAKHPGTLRLLDAGSVIIALDAGKSFSGAGSPGDIVTLAALDEGARCSTEGLRYALRDESLARGSRGLSNIIEGGPFSVSVSSGTVLVIQLKGDHRAA
ncbi:MAG TPA: thiamine diphosphokinase [Spirochaetota bacterium]|nr:thiamine diphosphokinase [Spirochaetota bacterium]